MEQTATPRKDSDATKPDHDQARGTEVVRVSCFGLSVTVDRNHVNSRVLSRGIDSLNRSLGSAIASARQRLRDDQRGSISYPASNPQSLRAYSSQLQFSGISVLDDCGLPVVDSFRAYLDCVLSNEISTTTPPAMGMKLDTLTTLWNPRFPKLIPITWGRLSEFHQLSHYLARLDSENDPIWQGETQQQWFAAFGGGLVAYMRELFGGRFVDRNGASISFDWRSVLKSAATQPTNFDPAAVSPQLAGAIVSVLIEYLGDRLFAVPFCSTAILGAYREYRANKATVTSIEADLTALLSAIGAGVLPAAKAPLIGRNPAGGNINIPCTLSQQSGTPTTLAANSDYRMVLSKVNDLDQRHLAELLSGLPLKNSLDAIEANTSPLESTYTCFKTQTITDHLHCIFIPDPGSQGVCGRDQETGNLDITTHKVDYADLVGTLVSLAATTVDKNVRSIVGGLIRGISVAALQNEVIAEVVSAIAATLAKKLVEYVAFTGLTAFISGSNTPNEKRAVLDLLLSELITT